MLLNLDNTKDYLLLTMFSYNFFFIVNTVFARVDRMMRWDIVASGAEVVNSFLLKSFIDFFIFVLSTISVSAPLKSCFHADISHFFMWLVSFCLVTTILGQQQQLVEVVSIRDEDMRCSALFGDRNLISNTRFVSFDVGIFCWRTLTRGEEVCTPQLIACVAITL
ncbi:hypothetical protein Cni_G24358 [Canna indica]|uniref:Uncharacterized protein n=1 Tax=Canna indica TaxID=4628 RepID=A0AAQ3KXW1_9LILI|nr:hypothetical protein Cni_G24358 [Canna indica]